MQNKIDAIELKNSYLTHIKIYIKSYNNDKHLLRTFIDNWFAYYKRGPFLTKNNRPKWFNNPNPRKSKNALLSMHFISKNAYEVINKDMDVRLIKEHSLPVSVIYKLLFEEKYHCEKDIESFLINYYKLGVITKEEDDKLTKNKLKDAMPEGWNKYKSVFDRYKEVNILKYDIE